MREGETSPLSPYEAVLGAEAIAALPESLAAYFRGIPPGQVGRGTGVFSAIGIPQRWLRPVIAVVGRGGAMFPVWERHVPFTVENRPVRADGHPAVAAVRTLELAGGSRGMVDLIAAVPLSGRVQLVDVLGSGRTLLVLLDAEVTGEELRMRASEVRLRFGRVRMRIPSWFLPRLALRERRGADGRQHLALTVDLPVLGRIYEYAGSFDYAIVPGAGAGAGARRNRESADRDGR